MRSILIVHPDVSLGVELGRTLAVADRFGHQVGGSEVVVQTTFTAARAVLQVRPPSLLVTPIGLREYNGLHLVYLARTISQRTRSVVHTTMPHEGHARDVRAAGAFYELQARLGAAIPAYLAGALPTEDRRMNVHRDRRSLTRPGTGRRSVDRYASV